VSKIRRVLPVLMAPRAQTEPMARQVPKVHKALPVLMALTALTVLTESTVSTLHQERQVRKDHLDRTVSWASKKCRLSSHWRKMMLMS
jgi:hypothetical protein